MKRLAFLFTFIFALASAANAQGLTVGATMENFSLADVNGKVHTLNDLKGKNGAVIMFVSIQCPVVRQYNERMNQITTDYAAKGITFIGINSNATETLDRVKMHAAETYKFPVLIDKDNILADKLGANVTPEAYFIDAKNVLLYHGRIDNDKTAANITSPDLRNAFNASLAGKKVEVSRALAFGCNISRKVK